jgi:hypothetical protein
MEFPSDLLDINLVHWTDIPFQLALEDQATRISRHYFVHVCRINSCFDSDTSPMRVEIGAQMASSPLIYHCVLSMAAAHQGGSQPTALDYRTKAICYLKSELANLKKERDTVQPLSSTNFYSVLLGCILLGMSDVSRFSNIQPALC